MMQIKIINVRFAAVSSTESEHDDKLKSISEAEAKLAQCGARIAAIERAEGELPEKQAQ